MRNELWRRCSAVAEYPGFHSYLEISGERTRFVINAKIEHISEVPKLQQYIKLMAGILALRQPPPRPEITGNDMRDLIFQPSQQVEIDEDWAE